MKLYSWNVNGIRAVVNKGAFQTFITEHDPDILCLQETKVDSGWVSENRGSLAMRDGAVLLRQGVAEATSRSKKYASAIAKEPQIETSVAIDLPAEKGQAVIDIPQYHEFWSSATKKGYSGTAIFSKTKPLSVINGFPEDIIKKFKLIDTRYGGLNEEGRLIAAEFEKFWVVTVYTPNSKGDLSRISLRQNLWDPGFLAYMKQLEKTKPVLFSGDLNVAHTEDDLANPKANVKKHGFTIEERGGFDNFVQSGFIDTFRLFTQGNGHYTWWTHWANARARNVGWRIDYWLASASLKDNIKAATIHPEVIGSDHCPVSVEVDV